MASGVTTLTPPSGEDLSLKAVPGIGPGAYSMIRKVLYNSGPQGYCGDEDNGQTSAWYVFTALGFYPVCPGSNEYVMGAPYFKKATITLENGKKLEISAPKNSDANRYIRSLNYNGKNYTKNYLNHFDLLKGGRLVFDMDNKPNKGRGINESDFPYSFSRDNK